MLFTVEERDAMRDQLLSLARADSAIVGAAITGSQAVDGSDRWSDIDLALGVEGPLEATMRRWTELINHDFAAIHHWDLPAGSTVYRVFLLPNGLEVDLAFLPAADFGPHGPGWRTVFGHPAPRADDPAAEPTRALGAATNALLAELALVDQTLAARLAPVLTS